MVAGFYSKEIKEVQYVLPAVKKMLDEGYAVYLHIIGAESIWMSLFQKLTGWGCHSIVLFMENFGGCPEKICDRHDQPEVYGCLSRCINEKG